jgi:hypothetical protein
VTAACVTAATMLVGQRDGSVHFTLMDEAGAAIATIAIAAGNLSKTQDVIKLAQELAGSSEERRAFAAMPCQGRA